MLPCHDQGTIHSGQPFALRLFADKPLPTIAHRTGERDEVVTHAQGSSPFGSLDAVLERVTAHAELEGVTTHTLRHSFASTAGDFGYSDSTIGAMLGHAGGTITRRYVHHLDAVLVAAADRVAGQIGRLL